MLAAGQRHTPQSNGALEELCRAYWFPLYAYVRRRGHNKEDAEDLVQAFFARFLAKNHLTGLNAERGRFRAFLLASLKHFLANEWDKVQAQKRGGGVAPLSLDWQTADTKFQVAATNEPSPDKAFDREWALVLLAKVIERLQQESAADGKAKLFAELKSFLMAGKNETAQSEVAKALGIHYSHSGLSLMGKEIWLEDKGIVPNKEEITITTRIGVAYAAEDALLPYRFIFNKQKQT